MKSKKVIGISVGCVCALAVVALAVVLLVSRCGKEDKGVVKASPVTYVVKYESHGGAAVKDGKYTPGEKFVLPTPASGSDPKMYGYSFTSWSYDADGKDTATVPLDEDKAVNGVITLHAGWTNVHTVYFDTRTTESIEPRQYKFGDRIPVADLPRATDRVVGGTPVPYVSWVNASTGQAITEDLRMEGTDMYLYAKYDTGVTSKFELLDDGTYRPMVTGAAAQTTYRDWELQDGQVYSLDMILPADPADFNGDAGPVFAATGFDERLSLFSKNDFVWLSVLRSHNPGAKDYTEKYRGALRLWGHSEKDDQMSPNSTSLAFYMRPNSALKGTAYERKMSAYLNGGKTNKETVFTFTIRRSGYSWYVGIDGIEYFTVEVGNAVLPTAVKPDEGGVKLPDRYTKGLLVGFRSNTMNVRFANISLKDAKSVKQNPANRHTVYFDTKTSQKMNPRSCYPGETVTLPQCPPRKVQGKDYKFLYWVDENTGLPVQSNFRMPTCDMHLFAQYDIGTTSKFELLDDGTYRPTVTGTAAQTTYFNWKLNDWQIFTVDMILPEDPSKFDGDAGPVFAATGFNEKTSLFSGYDYIWTSVLRSHNTGGKDYTEKYRGALRFWQQLAKGDGKTSDSKSIAFYMRPNGVLKGTDYEKKMSAYLKGGKTNKETKFTFTVRRAGNTWYFGIDGKEYVTLEVGKTVLPAAAKGDEVGGKLDGRFANGVLVGLRSNTKNVRFGNLSIKDANPEDYKSTITFETATGQKIDPQKYFTGETVSSSNLPTGVNPLGVQDKSYNFLYWVDKATGLKVADSFKINKDMTLVAHYDIGTTPRFELLQDGTYKPTVTGTNAQTNFYGKQLNNWQIFSIDMILPSDPAKFDGDAGPVFAATGFNEQTSLFSGYDSIWMSVLRSHNPGGEDYNDKFRGTLRIWQTLAGSSAQSLAFYKKDGVLKGSDYVKKMSAYLSGGKTDRETKFTFTVRKVDSKWYIGIDGTEYFTVEAGKGVLPTPVSPDEGKNEKLDSKFSKGVFVGFRSNTMNVRFGNISVTDADPDDYKSTITFETATVGEKIAEQKYFTGETVSASELPKDVKPRVVKQVEYKFDYWIDKETGKKVPDSFTIGKNMTFVAHYDIGVSSAFELLDDGTYKPTVTGTNAQTNYYGRKLEDQQIFSIDMILPSDPAKFDGDAGPVFAATGFNEQTLLFNGYDSIWMSVLRSHNAGGKDYTEKFRGALRIWQTLVGSDAQSLAFYMRPNTTLNGTEYEKKMSAYLSGGKTDKETVFTFSIRRAGSTWYIGIDGKEYFSLEVGEAVLPTPVKPDEGGVKLDSRFSEGAFIGFRSNTQNVRFANIRLEDTASAQPDPANYRTVYFRTNTPSKVEAITRIPGQTISVSELNELGKDLKLKIGDVECPFIAWAYDGTDDDVSGDINVSVGTGDIHIHAIYDITKVTGEGKDTGVNAKTFELQKDGSYKSIVTGAGAQTDYFGMKLEDQQIFYVDMILPADPTKFDDAAGPVFAATGFNEEKSQFNGNNYIWLSVLQSHKPGGVDYTEKFRGALRIWETLAGSSAQSLAFYMRPNGFLNGTDYEKKMSAYLGGGTTNKETVFTFSIRRAGNTWHIGIDGKEYITLEVGKGVQPTPVKPDESGKALDNVFTSGTLVGFRSNTQNVRFANIRIEGAEDVMKSGLVKPAFADNAFARRLIFLPVDPDDVIKESFSPVRTNAKTETSGVRTVLLPAKALLARIKAIFRAGF